MTLPLRTLADRYHLAERVGRGGMGAVWRARDELLGRDVAVKEILLPHGLDDEELAVVRGRALREARAAAHVRHPAVVTIHDVVIEDGHPWIVMDFVRARSLAGLLDDDGALPVASVARIGLALAGALRAIHAEGIVHRDVKPANVLIDDSGDVVLTDFGIATIDGDVRFTASGMLIGTPGYMAPERLSGEASGPPSDLWALGAVLYAAVEGNGPYAGSTPMVIASAVLTGDPAPTKQAGPLAPLITDLLARDPAARPDARRTAERLAALAQTADHATRADSATRTDGAGRTDSAVRTDSATRADPRPVGRTEPGPGRTRAEASGAGGQARREPAPAVRRPPVPVEEPRRRILSPGRVAGAIVVFILGVCVYWLFSMPFGGGDDPASTIDPCTLLSAAQLNQLAPGAQKMSLSPECKWDGGLAVGLTVSLTDYSNTQEVKAALHNGQAEQVSNPSVDVSGIGDEVYAYTNAVNGENIVLFRRHLHFVEIDYTGAAATQKQYAIQAARWVDQNLRVADG